MFDSKILASELIDRVRDEADIALPIPDASYISWINETEQMLYTELIREQNVIVIANLKSATVALATLAVPSVENAVRFEDVHAVYADGVQLIRTDPQGGAIFKNSYYKLGNELTLNAGLPCAELKLIYFVKPALKTAQNIDQKHIMLPCEFVPLIAAKLRGEAYKLANEDALAAKWLNDYNALLSHFGTWLASKSAKTAKI